jgi:Smg protein
MFDVLAYVCDNANPNDCGPHADQLVCQLNAVGFEAEQINAALAWLRALQVTAQTLRFTASPTELPLQGMLRPCALSVRVYPPFEQRHLGAQCLAFIASLEAHGALPAHVREVVLERAMATPGVPLALEDLKLIVRMVCTKLEFDPGAHIWAKLGAFSSVTPVLH